MAKPWVEGGYYEECSGKWGWKNKERERTKVKWLKNSLKKKEIFKNYEQEKKRVTYTNEERKENSKVKEHGKLGEKKWETVEGLADM